MTSLLRYFGMPEVASAHGNGIDELILYVHLLMGALFVGWLGYFLLAMVRFNKAANPKADYVGVRSHASTYLEIGVAVVEGGKCRTIAEVRPGSARPRLSIALIRVDAAGAPMQAW